MQRNVRLVLCVLMALVVTASLPAGGSDLSVFLHSVFEDQYGRVPTGTEVNYYSNVSRTEGPLESQIRMVAADSYYHGPCKQNPDIYITRVYEIFLGRAPTADELRYWVGQLPRGTSNERAAFIRRFCQANNLVYYVPSTPAAFPAVVRPSNSQSNTAETLVAKATLLNDMIRSEMGGTRFGRDLASKSATLVSAAAQYRDTVGSPRSTSQQVAIAAANVGLAVRDLTEQFRSVPGASAACDNTLWEVSQLANSIRPADGAAPAQPPRNAIESEAAHLAAVTREFAAVLFSEAQQNPLYANVYRDVSGLSVQAESLQQLARAGAGQRELQRVMTGILSQARGIGTQLTSANGRLRRAWWNVQHEVDQLAVAAGMGGDFYASDDHPVILNSPAWDGFPVQPSPGYQSSSDNLRIVSSCDELVRLLDNYTQSLRPITNRNRDAAQMLDQTLDMRHQVLVLRQQAAAGQFGAVLSTSSREAVRQYKDVASRTFLVMVGQDPTLNSPIWSQIGELTYAIDKMAGGSRY
jgi:hypothetical protein